MSRDRIVELLKEHTWYLAGNLGVPGMPDWTTYKCYCGWSGDDPHGHVADQILTVPFTAKGHVHDGPHRCECGHEWLT